MSLADKTDPRVAAYGDVDEANSALGVALAVGGLPGAVADVLRAIQNELFDVGADLSNPLPRARSMPAAADHPGLCRSARELVRLIRRSPAQRCVPSSCPAGRCRRLSPHRPNGDPAGRASPGWPSLATIRTRRRPTGEARPAASIWWPSRYLNRLSDLLFILTRVVNGAEGGRAVGSRAATVTTHCHTQPRRIQP